ncbi:MAG: hypothetical protein ACHRHE_01650 [Tepidisphaerales bacterium]
MLYPLKFKPRLAGQSAAVAAMGHRGEEPRSAIAATGESWELVDFPPGSRDGNNDWLSSEVADGPLAGLTLHQVIADFGRAVHGDVPLHGPRGRFPIQVRTVDEREGPGLGVNTAAAAWYVVQAEPGARVVRSLRAGVDPAGLERAIAAGNFESLCLEVSVKSGDCLFLPPGTVHAQAVGIVAVEMQTPGDSMGKLGVAEAVAVGRIRLGGSLAAYQRRSHVAGLFTTVTRLVTWEEFVVEKVRFVEGVEEIVPYDQPVVWIVLDGKAEIRVDGLKMPVGFGRGDTLLIPAEMKNPVIKTLSNCVWLEVTFPKRSGADGRQQ